MARALIARYYMAFISSTTQDLEHQRIDVFRTLINGHWIPISMESFAPGAKTVEFIQEQIALCDAVVIILNNYYGSRIDPSDPAGISYTEMEYRYAVDCEVPIIALVRSDPENYPGQSAEDWESFRRFRKEVLGAGHIVGMWSDDPKHLNQQLVYNLQNGIVDQRMKLAEMPEKGWLRATEVPPQYRQLIESCKQLGIDRILSDGFQRQEELDDRLSSATTIKIFATTAEPLIRAKANPLTLALSRGARLQVLVAQEQGQFIQDVEEIESRRDAAPRDANSELRKIRGYLGGYLSSAKDLCARNGGVLGSVAVGAYTTHFRSTLILCDDNWGKLTITIPPQRATTTASFELIPQALRDPLLRQCHEHFDHNWKIAELHSRIEEIPLPK